VGADGTGLRRLTDEEARRRAARQLSKDKKLTVFTEEGDVFIYGHERSERRQLTRTVESESNAHFTRDQRPRLLHAPVQPYVMSLDRRLARQLTDITRSRPARFATATRPRRARAAPPRRGRARVRISCAKRSGNPPKPCASAESARSRRSTARAGQRTSASPSHHTGQTVTSLLLSPDGSYVVLTVTEPLRAEHQSSRTSSRSRPTRRTYRRTKVGRRAGTHAARPRPRSRRARSSGRDGSARRGRAARPDAHRAETDRDACASAAKDSRRDRTDRAGQSTQTQGQTGADADRRTVAAVTGSQSQPPRTPAQSQQPKARRRGRPRGAELFQCSGLRTGRVRRASRGAADNRIAGFCRSTRDGQNARARACTRRCWVGGPGAFTLAGCPTTGAFLRLRARRLGDTSTPPLRRCEPSQLTTGRFEVSDVRCRWTRRSSISLRGGQPLRRHLYTMPTDGGARTRLTTMPGNNQ